MSTKAIDLVDQSEIPPFEELQAAYGDMLKNPNQELMNNPELETGYAPELDSEWDDDPFPDDRYPDVPIPRIPSK
ncbi:MAG: hypothetical protein CFE43_17335 [Burkholderiales bacterium PBB3]|nr:MAG: hypothetical protein CFE43_17335 [Burkholderiales bacterium PBB3]